MLRPPSRKLIAPAPAQRLTLPVTDAAEHRDHPNNEYELIKDMSVFMQRWNYSDKNAQPNRDYDPAFPRQGQSPAPAVALRPKPISRSAIHMTPLPRHNYYTASTGYCRLLRSSGSHASSTRFL